MKFICMCVENFEKKIFDYLFFKIIHLLAFRIFIFSPNSESLWSPGMSLQPKFKHS